MLCTSPSRRCRRRSRAGICRRRQRNYRCSFPPRSGRRDLNPCKCCRYSKPVRCRRTPRNYRCSYQPASGRCCQASTCPRPCPWLRSKADWGRHKPRSWLVHPLWSPPGTRCWMPCNGCWNSTDPPGLRRCHKRLARRCPNCPRRSCPRPRRSRQSRRSPRPRSSRRPNRDCPDSTPGQRLRKRYRSSRQRCPSYTWSCSPCRCYWCSTAR